MPITINGDGTVTGISAGGLPDGSISTADIADDAVTLAKLSTTGTPGAGNFLRGDNSWQEAGGGAWNYISTAVASTSAYLEFTGFSSTYEQYVCVLSNMRPATDNMAIGCRFGNSSGQLSGNNYSMYVGKGQGSNGNYSAQWGSSQNKMLIGPNGGNGTDETLHAVCYIGRLPQASGTTLGIPGIHGTYRINDPSGYQICGFLGGDAMSYGQATDMDRFYILANSGNITSGRATLYGIAHS